MTDESADDSGTGGSLEVSVKQEVMEEDHQQVERESVDDDDDEDALKMDTSEPVEDVQAQDQKIGKDDDKDMKEEEEEKKSAAFDERENVKEALKDAESEPQEAAPNAKTPPPTTPLSTVVEPIVVIKTEPGTVSVTPAESNTIRPWSNGVIFSHRRAITPSGTAVSAELVPITNGTSSSSSRKTASPSSSPPPPQTTAPAPALSTNRVPSVILGQSGGVKTMVWTGHWADQQNKSNSSSSSSSSAPNAKPAPIHHNSDAASIRLSVDGLLSLASASALAQQNEFRRHSSASFIGRQSSPPSQVDLSYYNCVMCNEITLCIDVCIK